MSKKEVPKQSKLKLVKHKESPFLENFTVSTKGKRVTVNQIGKTNDMIVSPDTGEIKGTHVVAYRQVDDAEFVKIFTANIALTFELNQSGRKVFDMLIRVMQHSAITRDQVYIDEHVREEFATSHNVNLASATMYRGIDNLIERKIIARSQRTNIYFINPSLVFNGDRVAFSTVIERKKKNNKTEELNDREK
jgi:hypothetical protein